jgi:hypothetical protein
MYVAFNSVRLNWFAVLPIFNPDDVKNTWDSLERANSERSAYLEADPGLLERFLVFADIGDGACAAMERATGVIWYEEGDELVETPLSLPEFIETGLKEASE